MTTKKDFNEIQVCFHKERVSAWPTITKELGTISPDKFQELLGLLLSAKLKNNCISSFKFHTEQGYSYNPETKEVLPDKILLNFKDFHWSNMKFYCAKTNEERANYNSSYNSRLETCYNNLKSGKCECQFMINTFGKIIFPELYKNKIR